MSCRVVLCCAVLCPQVPEEAKRAELAGLFGLSAEDIADISSQADKQAAAAKEEEEAFFL